VAPRGEEAKEFGSWPGFRDGKYAMFISGPWQQARLADSQFRWDIAWPPLQPNGKPIMNAGGGGAVVYVKTKIPQEAFKWVSYIESAESQAIWAGLGFDLPSHPSLVKDYVAGKFFTNPKAIPPSVDLWYKVVEVSLKSPHTYIPAQASDLLNQAFGPVAAGDVTAKDAFTKVNPDVNAALKTC
jgi:ABC-type glycerol-3-phosphate transport system substrate-binding protein